MKQAYELPIKIQTIVYQVEGNNLKVLLIKRVPNDGGFWQTITGTLEINESIEDSRARELKEETGITDSTFYPEEIHRFSWKKKHWTVVEIVYAAKVNSSAVTLNPEEHEDYQWVSIEAALNIVDIDGIKDSLNAFNKLIEKIKFIK